MISLAEVLKKMSTPDENGEAVPFSIEFIKYDKKRRTGGQKAFYPEAILCYNPTPKTEMKTQSEEFKKPKHSQNDTRNIEILNCGAKTGVIRKIHILLIVKFNGELVH